MSTFAIFMSFLCLIVVYLLFGGLVLVLINTSSKYLTGEKLMNGGPNGALPVILWPVALVIGLAIVAYSLTETLIHKLNVKFGYEVITLKYMESNYRIPQEVFNFLQAKGYTEDRMPHFLDCKGILHSEVEDCMNFLEVSGWRKIKHSRKKIYFTKFVRKNTIVNLNKE